jgi:hypothetical protein
VSIYCHVSHASSESDPLTAESESFVWSVGLDPADSLADLSLLPATESFEDSTMPVRISTLDAPLSFSADGSGASIGMIVGVPVCVLALLTGGIVIAVLFVRKLNVKTGGDENSQPGRSTLRTEFADDGLDATKDPTVTTLADNLTDDLASDIPTALNSEFMSDVALRVIL